MIFKKIAISVAIAASTSAAMAGEGFYAGVGISAVGSSFNRIEGALNLNAGATNTVGVVDVGYISQFNNDWGIGYGATLDMSKTKAGSIMDADQHIKFSAKNHNSVYVQPTFNLNSSTAVFGKIGYHKIRAEVVDLDGNNDSLALNGVGYGFGMKTMATKNIYLQAEVMWVDYKAKTDTLDTNKLKPTSGLVSIGYQFN